MRFNTAIFCFSAAALLFTAPTPSMALWGKAETKTEDGDADMGLGEYKGLKHAIGVKGFENEAGWSGHWELGDNLAAMLESALYDSGRFVLVEREKLDDVIEEQDLMASGRMAKSSKIAQTGLLRGAKYLATGSVTEMDKSQSGGGGGISIGGISLGLKKNEAHLAIIAKLIDTTTGEIVAKKRIVGSPGGTGLRIGFNKYGVGGNLDGFKETPMGQAAQDCIVQAAKFFAQEMEEFPFEGSVVKATSDGEVIINRGSQFGVESGQILVMTTQGEVLIDDDTGEILDREEGREIGKLEVDRVKEKVSYCKVLEGETTPEKGTIVRAQ